MTDTVDLVDLYAKRYALAETERAFPESTWTPEQRAFVEALRVELADLEAIHAEQLGATEGDNGR